MLPFVSIQVFSLEVYAASNTWLKERRIFTPKVFLFHAQTILEVIEKFCVISVIEVVSKLPVSKSYIFRSGIKSYNHFLIGMIPTSFPGKTRWKVCCSYATDNNHWGIVLFSALPEPFKDAVAQSILPSFIYQSYTSLSS